MLGRDRQGSLYSGDDAHCAVPALQYIYELSLGTLVFRYVNMSYGPP